MRMAIVLAWKEIDGPRVGSPQRVGVWQPLSGGLRQGHVRNHAAEICAGWFYLFCQLQGERERRALSRARVGQRVAI